MQRTLLFWWGSYPITFHGVLACTRWQLFCGDCIPREAVTGFVDFVLRNVLHCVRNEERFILHNAIE